MSSLMYLTSCLDNCNSLPMRDCDGGCGGGGNGDGGDGGFLTTGGKSETIVFVARPEAAVVVVPQHQAAAPTTASCPPPPGVCEDEDETDCSPPSKSRKTSPQHHHGVGGGGEGGNNNSSSSPTRRRRRNRDSRNHHDHHNHNRDHPQPPQQQQQQQRPPPLPWSSSVTYDLGMTFMGVNQRAYVRSVTPGSAAAKAGIRPRDSVSFAFVQTQTAAYEDHHDDDEDGGGTCGAAGLCGAFECIPDDYYTTGIFGACSSPCKGGTDLVADDDDFIKGNCNDDGKISPSGETGQKNGERQKRLMTKYALDCERQGIRTSFAELCEMFPFDITGGLEEEGEGEERTMDDERQQQQQEQEEHCCSSGGGHDTPGKIPPRAAVSSPMDATPRLVCASDISEDSQDEEDGACEGDDDDDDSDDDSEDEDDEVSEYSEDASQWSDTSHLKKLKSRERITSLDDVGCSETLTKMNTSGELQVKPVVMVFRRGTPYAERLVCPCEQAWWNVACVDFIFMALGSMM